MGYATPSCDPDIYREINRRVRELCPDIVISNTTGAGFGVPVEERIRSIQAGAEICSLNVGTMAIRMLYRARKPPLKGRLQDEEFNGTFTHTYQDTEKFARYMLEKGIKPEIETYDSGNFWLVRNLINKNLITPPYFHCLVMGYQSSSPPTPWHLLNLMAMAPANSIWNVIGIGVHELPMTTLAIILGAHVRVGMEDNIYYSRGVKARSNAELVARTVRIAKELQRPIATPSETREILRISKTPRKFSPDKTL
jgi:3-keto-5-aminohexanoate cleavage enzyme